MQFELLINFLFSWSDSYYYFYLCAVLRFIRFFHRIFVVVGRSCYWCCYSSNIQLISFMALVVNVMICVCGLGTPTMSLLFGQKTKFGTFKCDINIQIRTHTHTRSSWFQYYYLYLFTLGQFMSNEQLYGILNFPRCLSLCVWMCSFKCMIHTLFWIHMTIIIYRWWWWRWRPLPPPPPLSLLLHMNHSVFQLHRFFSFLPSITYFDAFNSYSNFLLQCHI